MVSKKKKEVFSDTLSEQLLGLGGGVNWGIHPCVDLQ